MVVIFLACVIVSVIVNVWIIRHAKSHAMQYGIDMPQRFHKGSVPRLGGLGMLVSLSFGWIFIFLDGGKINLPEGSKEVIISLVFIFPAILCGIAEDITQKISVKIRLAVTMLAAAFICYFLNISVNRLDVFWIDEIFQSIPFLGVMVAIFAIGGLPHAFNIIDGYNGLAGMVAILIALALVHISLQLGDRLLAGMLVCMIGATVGFLIFNFPYGKIFAGDGGAYFWGILIAFSCVMLVFRHPSVSPWFPMLLLSYPVLETFFSIYRKLVRGQSPGMADALHLHQLIYRRIVRVVLDDEDKEMLHRNNKTSPYLWGVSLLTVMPAVLFWNKTFVLMIFCGIFFVFYISAYLMIVRFKLPSWISR